MAGKKFSPTVIQQNNCGDNRYSQNSIGDLIRHKDNNRNSNTSMQHASGDGMPTLLRPNVLFQLTKNPVDEVM